MNTVFNTLLAGLLALCAVALPATVAAQSTAPVDSIVAVVDEDVILRSELDRAVGNILAQYASQPGQLPPRDVLERQVLDRLIVMRLQLVRATESGVRVSDAELEQAVASVAQRNGLGPDQLRQRLAADGISYEEFRGSLREEMLLERLRQGFVQSRVQVSEAEIDQHLATRSTDGAEIRLANILVALPDGATPEQIATAKQKIDGIRAVIARGELDFAAAAIRYSDAQNALDGGELGWRTYDAIPPAFAALLRQMQPGQITEAVRGPNGYQIVQLVETRQAGPQTLEEFHAQGLLIRITPTRPDDAARQKAEDLRARIAAGEDFAAIARAESDDTVSRGDGGDMGWFPVGAWGSAVAAQLQALADGELSQPFRSEVGWHVIRRLGTRQSDVTEKNRRNQAREQITQRKAEEEYERFLRQLRSEAFVESRLGAPAAPSP
jgi:peptidyl-prolyl cis-trans isomerase SurA